MTIFPGKLRRRLADRPVLDNQQIQRRHQTCAVGAGLAMHQRRKLDLGEQVAGGVKHRLVGRGTGPRGEIKKGDPGGSARLGLKLPSTITPRAAKIDHRADAGGGGGADSGRSGLVGPPQAGRDKMLVVPPDSQEPVVLEDQLRPVAHAAPRSRRCGKAHDPATIMPSTRSDGAAVLRRMSISSARVMAMNMSFRLPAMVASATG